MYDFFCIFAPNMKKYWFIFCKTDLLLEKLADGTYTIPYEEEPPVEVKEWNTIHNITPLPSPYGSLFQMRDGEIKTLRIDAPVTGSERYEMCPLRASYFKLPLDVYLTAGKCQEILYWDYNTKYCGVCGSPMKLHTDISKRCTSCGKEVWPQLAIAIIVLIHKDDEVLLVHANNFKRDYYGLVAGFVETGETLEQAVEREVAEEVGLKIRNIRYFDSQPWPYPCGLMVGFHADYVSGEIHLQRSEIAAGGWYGRDNLPNIPEKLSIARRLIDDWLCAQTE